MTVGGTTYEDFGEGTGYYGTGPYAALGDRLCGVNCRHHWGPWFPGMPRAYHPNPRHPSGKSNAEIYDLTQRQRRLERGIRDTKRELKAAEAAYAASPTLKNQTEANRVRDSLKRQQERLAKLCAENKDVLKRQANREGPIDTRGTAPRGSSITMAEYIERPDVQKRLKAAGISDSAFRKKLAEELKADGITGRGFAGLTSQQQRRAEDSTRRALPSVDFDNHFDSKRANAARSAYAGANDIIATAKGRTGIEFEIDREWFESLPREQQVAVMTGIDYGTGFVGEPSRSLLAVRRYDAEGDEYGRHQRRANGYIIELSNGLFENGNADEIEQVTFHEIAHSAENALTTWEEYEAERDALLAWRGTRGALGKRRLSGIILEELAQAGFDEFAYDAYGGRVLIYGDTLEMAMDISDYAVFGAQVGDQDSELAAECIRHVANRGRNGIATGITRRLTS